MPKMALPLWATAQDSAPPSNVVIKAAPARTVLLANCLACPWMCHLDSTALS